MTQNYTLAGLRVHENRSTQGQVKTDLQMLVVITGGLTMTALITSHSTKCFQFVGIKVCFSLVL